MFIVKAEGGISYFIHARDWPEEDEACPVVHTLVEADPDATEQLFSIQKDARALAEFVIDREGPRLREALARREPVDEADFADVISFLDAQLPKLRPLWSELRPTSVPALLWRDLTRYIDNWRRLEPMRSPETEAVFDHRAHGMAQHLLLLLDPELASFAARYDSHAMMLQAAVMTLARDPLRDIGILHDVQELPRAAIALLSRGAASRAFVAMRTFWIVRKPDARALRKRVAEVEAANEHERAGLRDLDAALAKVDGTFLMTITKRGQLELSIGAESNYDEGGVWRIVPYRRKAGA